MRRPAAEPKSVAAGRRRLVRGEVEAPSSAPPDRSWRRHDLPALALERSLETVVSLLWTGRPDSEIFDTPLHVISGADSGHDLSFLKRAQSVLPMVSARDPFAGDLSVLGAASTGWRILNLMTSIACRTQVLEQTVEETLEREWTSGRPVSQKGQTPVREVLRTAMLLAAGESDELTSRTARCVASAAANPYSVVIGGLVTFDGEPCESIEITRAAFDELSKARDMKREIARRVARGDTISGFSLRSAGVSLRSPHLLSILPPSAALTSAKRMISAAEAAGCGLVTYTLALVIAERVLELPSGAAEVLAALGGSIGWIADAIEVYDAGTSRGSSAGE